MAPKVKFKIWRYTDVHILAQICLSKLATSSLSKPAY